MRITKIERKKFDGYVYNLGVEEHHNYFANNILVHNCYMDSKDTGKHFENIIDKIKAYFGPMSENQRPFQVAIGGGEPTAHPDFIELLKTFKDFDIEPNYTTNGMFSYINQPVNTNIINATAEYCGGVAVSCHPHLMKYWNRAANLLINANVRLNFHLIISDKESIDEFKDIYDTWKDTIEYFVLLPYGNQGRAPHKEIDWEYLIKVLPENTNNIAFGANFYPYLLQGGHNIKVSLYEPEILSRFFTLEGSGKIYPSSFNLDEVVKENVF